MQPKRDLPPAGGEKKRHLWAELLFLTWLLGSALGLYYLTFKDYGEFDPEQLWLGWQAPTDIGQRLDLAADANLVTLVSVREGGCSCNSYVDAHLQQHAAVNVVERTPAQLSQLGFVVPASPMAMVFYGQQLVYAGPFASGPFCATDNSLIDDIVNQNTRLAGTFLNGLIKACRCT